MKYYDLDLLGFLNYRVFLFFGFRKFKVSYIYLFIYLINRMGFFLLKRYTVFKRDIDYRFWMCICSCFVNVTSF